VGGGEQAEVVGGVKGEMEGEWLLGGFLGGLDGELGEEGGGAGVEGYGVALADNDSFHHSKRKTINRGTHHQPTLNPPPPNPPHPN
jgi:hypothetical protein